LQNIINNQEINDLFWEYKNRYLRIDDEIQFYRTYQKSWNNTATELNNPTISNKTLFEVISNSIFNCSSKTSSFTKSVFGKEKSLFTKIERANFRINNIPTLEKVSKLFSVEIINLNKIKNSEIVELRQKLYEYFSPIHSDRNAISHIYEQRTINRLAKKPLKEVLKNLFITQKKFRYFFNIVDKLFDTPPLVSFNNPSHNNHELSDDLLDLIIFGRMKRAFYLSDKSIYSRERARKKLQNSAP